jgi:hypothetical protein
MIFQEMIGIGVAGNFTGHLEQAGEAKDFIQIVAEKDAPKGIFPFYIPNDKSFLGVYPLSSTQISMFQNAPLQPEPEVALICDIQYENEKVLKIIPVQFGAYNDCSIRADAPKISKKKNWGKNSKGLSDQLIKINSFSKGGIMDDYNLVCFLKRAERVNIYGENSEVKTYSYFYDTLMKWLVDKINNQQDNGPLENIHVYLEKSGFPTRAIVSIGATRYTTFGEKTYLEKGDEVFVIVYPRSMYTIAEIMSRVSRQDKVSLDNVSVLQQIVV